MNIVYNDIIDWEPAVLSFVFNDGEALKLDIKESIRGWFTSRSECRLHDCKCFLQFIEIDGIDRKRNKVTVLCQWICKRCVGSLYRYVDEQVSSIDHMELGINFPDEDLVGMETQWIYVPERTVLFEDCREELVKPFFTTKRPVSNAEFAEFCVQTGYVTTAEKEDPDLETETYFENALLHGLSKREKEEAYVVNVSYFDVEEYCKWRNVRLLTEKEWLSAAVIEPVLLEKEPEFQDIRRFQSLENALFFECGEWTSSIDHETGLVVRRSGPQYALYKGWEKSHYRQLSKKGVYDYFTFRVCKDV